MALLMQTCGSSFFPRDLRVSHFMIQKSILHVSSIDLEGRGQLSSNIMSRVQKNCKDWGCHFGTGPSSPSPLCHTPQGGWQGIRRESGLKHLSCPTALLPMLSFYLSVLDRELQCRKLGHERLVTDMEGIGDRKLEEKRTQEGRSLCWELKSLWECNEQLNKNYN